MKCPVCNIDMIVVEYNQIEVDHCLRCQGVWFDSGELELLLKVRKTGQSSQINPFGLSEAQTTETKRKCPICGKKMKKVLIGEEPKVLIDSCPENDGLWFDCGEVEQLTSQLTKETAGKPNSHIMAHFSDVFRVQDKTNN